MKDTRRETLSLEKNPTTGLVIELFGPTFEFLTSPEYEHNDFCVLNGTIPPNAYVPLHSHTDTEDFFVMSGAVDCLRHDTQEEGYKVDWSKNRRLYPRAFRNEARVA